MKVLDVTEIKLERLDFKLLTQHPWTAYEVVPGAIGVASIVRYIGKKLGKYTFDDAGDEMPLRALVGMGWEAMAAQLYPSMRWQPGVLELDGVVGHPDGWDHVLLKPQFAGTPEKAMKAVLEPVTDEFKYTAKSIRVKGGKPDQHKSITDEWAWMCQALGYIRMRPDWEYLTRYLGRFHVCWAMGNYTRHTLDERYMRYLVEFEKVEVERNWAMLVEYRDEARKEMGL